MKPIFLFLLACFFAQAQDTLKFNVLGSVKDMENKTPVPNCQVVLKGSDGTLVLAKTDSTGNYSIRLKPETTYDIYTQTDKTVTTRTARFGFLASDDHGLFTTIDLKESQNFQKDFELTPVIVCEWGPPNFIFKKNSIVLDTLAIRRYDDIDSTIDLASSTFRVYTDILTHNPTIIIELSAHCSGNEKNADSLSIKRATFIKAELVKRGIAADRIVAKGWGARKRKMQDAQIAKEKTKEGKEALHSINRRCVFKILSWDYVDPNAPKAEMPEYHPPVRGEEDTEEIKAVEELPGKRMKENKLETPKKN